MTSTLNFSCEDDEILVELVAQNPPLYDSKLESYKYKSIRDNIWKDIGQEMTKPGDDCKKRWKNIKDSYNRFKRKRHKAGVPAEPKNSKWEFYERLYFLEASSDGEGITNTRSPSAESQNPESDIDTNDESIHSIGIKEEQLEPSQQNRYKVGQISQRIKRRRQQDEFLEYMKKWDNERQTLFKDFGAEKVERSTDEDDLISFGEHIKSVLKKLPPVMRITAKTELFSVLTKYELMSMETPNGTPSTSS